MQEIIGNIKEYLTYNHVIAGAILIFIVAVNIYIITPRVIHVAHRRNLIVPIGSRSCHQLEVPSLGGVSFFMVYLMCIPIINMIHFGSFAGYNVIGAITILFMVGLKDDLVNSSPRVKLYGQFLASFFIVLSPDFIITDYHGFLGVHTINPVLSMFLSMLFLVFFVNSFNLIDGLDGLASIIGIVIVTTFLFMFTIKGDYFFAALSLVTITMLTTFLRFNLSKGKLKMFMGDCGSMMVGLIIGILTLRYLASAPLPADQQLFIIENRFLFVFTVLFIPLLDTFRVIGVRILNGTSPLKADQNHLHHLLLQSFNHHFKVSISLGILNVAVILIFLSISNAFSVQIVSLIMFVITSFILLFFYLITLKIKKKNNLIFEEQKDVSNN